MVTAHLLEEREKQIYRKGSEPFEMDCNKDSLAGAVSQRACVFCGSRVVLYPIADALHLVHGPVGCAVYTWDIRGALSSGPELHRLSFSTDLQEMDVIFGGEKKLAAALDELHDTDFMAVAETAQGHAECRAGLPLAVAGQQNCHAALLIGACGLRVDSILALLHGGVVLGRS